MDVQTGKKFPSEHPQDWWKESSYFCPSPRQKVYKITDNLLYERKSAFVAIKFFPLSGKLVKVHQAPFISVLRSKRKDAYI